MHRYSIETKRDEFETLVLRDHEREALVELVPARGALVTRMCVAGRELLYLDRGTLIDASKNVRGGVPVLFPIAGRLANDRYALPDGRAFALKQHGFARARAWEVRATSSPGEAGAHASVTLGLASDDETRAVFPYDFDLCITFELCDAALALRVECRNRSEGAMPFHMGFHPYFYVPSASAATALVRTKATRAFDNVRKTHGPYVRPAFTEPEVDLHLLDHEALDTELRYSHEGRAQGVRLAWEPPFSTLVLWSVAGKDYLCVEPWTAPGDALNTHAGLVELAPGETLRTAFTFAPLG